MAIKKTLLKRKHAADTEGINTSANNATQPHVGQRNSRSSSVPKGEGNVLLEAFIGCEKSLKRFISRFMRKPEDIDELAQEAFLLAFDANKTREISAPKAYLFRVARNVALRELSKKNRQLTDYLEESVEADPAGSQASLDEELIAQQKLKLCCEAIAELPEQCRRVFLLRKVYALPHKDIAKQLGISHSTVEKHLAKGVDRYTSFVNRKANTTNALPTTALNPKTLL